MIHHIIRAVITVLEQNLRRGLLITRTLVLSEITTDQEVFLFLIFNKGIHVGYSPS